jgi:hypothetical protein
LSGGSEQVVAGVGRHTGDVGKLAVEHDDDRSNGSAMPGWSGSATMVRMAAATISEIHGRCRNDRLEGSRRAKMRVPLQIPTRTDGDR